MAAFPGISLIYPYLLREISMTCGGFFGKSVRWLQTAGWADCVPPLSIQVEKPPCGAFLVTGWLGEF